MDVCTDSLIASNQKHLTKKLKVQRALTFGVL